MDSLRTGTLLQGGTYRIEYVLGQGGFGITYLATDINLNRKVAVKEFFPKDFCNRDGESTQVTLGTSNTADRVRRLRARFLREGQNIAALDNPGVIRIFAAFEENNTAYYVMEYIEGESLSAMVRQHGPLPEHRALGYIRQVAEALEYVHGRCVNHLDIKPANILIRRSDDRAILIDFGLSKQFEDENGLNSSTIVGMTNGFAPMEQYTAGGLSSFSPKTDLYSLAATLYYMLSGVVPPEAPRLIDQALTFPDDIPLPLVGPISKAMSTSRAGRHESVHAFIDDLDQALAEEKDKATVVNPVVSVDSCQSARMKPRYAAAEVKRPQKSGKSSFRTLLTGVLIGMAVLIVAVVAICVFLDTSYEEAQAAYEKGDFTEALRLFRESADGDNANAQYMLGVMNFYGEGIEKDYAEAAKWFRKSASHGNADAQYLLGKMYFEGVGVEQNYTEAEKWYHKSAIQENADAQVELACMYFLGEGVEADYDEGMKWLQKASDNGNSQAAELLKELESISTDTQTNSGTATGTVGASA